MIAVGYQSCDSTLNIDKPSTFLKYLGRDGSQTGIDMEHDADGNIYVLGSSSLEGGRKQVFVVKTTSGGITIWEKLFGDPSDEELEAKDIEILSDGRVAVLANVVTDSERNFAIYLLNSSDGTPTRERVVFGESGVEDYAMSLTQIEDGFVVSTYKVTGAKKGGWVWRLTTNLEDVRTTPGSQWEARVDQFKDDGTESSFDVVPVKVVTAQDALGNPIFYTFGYTNSVLSGDAIPDFNFFFIVTDNNYNFLKPVIIEGPNPNSNERLTSIKRVPQADGDGFILAGPTDNGAIRVVRLLPDLSSGGSLKDTTYFYPNRPPRTISAALNNSATANVAVSSSISRAFFLLAEDATSGNSNIYLKKVGDTNGFPDAWGNQGDPYKTFGGVGNDTPGAVLETSDGFILICGTMVLGDALGQGKIVLMRLNSDGMLGDD